MTRAKNEIERTNGPRTGGYYWFPSQAGSTVEWSVLTCHDLGFGPDEGHFDMWPSVIDGLGPGRRAAQEAAGGPLLRPAEGAGDTTRSPLPAPPRPRCPVADWLERVVERFDLDRRTIRLLFDEHEQTFTGDRRAVDAEFRLPAGGSRPEGGEARC